MNAAIGVSAVLLALAAPAAAQPALSYDPHAGWGDPQAPAAAAASRPAQGAGGLYLATVRRLVFRATGGSEWTLNIEYYLLDPDGRVTAAGLPEAPGGGFLRFDYDEARAPRQQLGSYTVSGNRVSRSPGGAGQDDGDARRAGRARDPRHEIQALGEVAPFSESELDAEGGEYPAGDPVIAKNHAATAFSVVLVMETTQRRLDLHSIRSRQVVPRRCCAKSSSRTLRRSMRLPSDLRTASSSWRCTSDKPSARFRMSSGSRTIGTARPSSVSHSEHRPFCPMSPQ